MENKNYKTVTEILKDCPEGMELYSPVFGKCTFINVTNNIINVKMENGDSNCFYENGQYYSGGECLLFPSKECRDWSNFKKPFEKGDVIVSQGGNIAIYSHFEVDSYGEKVVYYQCLLHTFGDIKVVNNCGIGYIEKCRYATKEEKERLYKALEKEGYRYNPTTKNIERDELLILKKKLEEKAQRKFDVSTLKPFDKVLVRQCNTNEWSISLFEKFLYKEYSHLYRFKCLNNCRYTQCIPYKGNEHLLDTTNEPNDFFVTWE